MIKLKNLSIKHHAIVNLGTDIKKVPVFQDDQGRLVSDMFKRMSYATLKLLVLEDGFIRGWDQDVAMLTLYEKCSIIEVDPKTLPPGFFKEANRPYWMWTEESGVIPRPLTVEEILHKNTHERDKRLTNALTRYQTLQIVSGVRALSQEERQEMADAKAHVAILNDLDLSSENINWP